ncbi:MAG: hypothetical protein ACRDLB_00745, partial [Actinomycetota bacterium]
STPQDLEVTTTEHQGRAPIETLEVFAPRDPFDPLVGDQAGSGSEGGASGDAPAVEGKIVKLVDVSEPGDGRTAEVQVDGATYTVAEEEIFAENFKLLSISGDCASMLFGDDQFTLCEGDDILK